MKRITSLLVCLVFIGITAMAQNVQISGTVTNADDGSILPGVSVVVKGTTTGTTSNIDGKYTLSVPANSTLVFSFVGMKTQEIQLAGQTTLDVAMELEVTGLEEVVVTALGVSKEKKALGYAVSEVKGDDLNKARGGNSNPVNSLAGKVAGLQVTGASGNMGGSSKVVLRGVSSLSGNNQPLFVVDGVPIEGTDYNTTDAARGAGGYDYGNLVQDINPDDIESISVLKGPNASALYGSRATNGVIMITTKKGAKNEQMVVSLNSSVGFERVNKLPVMQKQYGGGYELTPTDINGVEYLVPDYGIDESWGPEFDPNIQHLSWYDVATWEANGMVGNPTTSPWDAPANDIDKFFELGHSFTNNISISQGGEKVSVRASYTNMTLDGYMPNSSLKKNGLNLSINASDNKFVELFGNINYMNQKAKGRPETGYGDNNVMQKFIQWGQRQLDMNELEDLYKFPDGTQASWNRNGWDDPSIAYSNNPYWTRYMNYQNDTRDRLYGNVGIRFTLMPDLKVQYKANLDFFSDKQYERSAVYSQEQSRFYQAHRQQYEINHEFLLTYSKKINDINVAVNAGSNLMYQNYQRLEGESVGGLVIPEFYNLSNSVSPALAEDFLREKAINSIFGNATIGYKSLAYLDATFRNDWSSALPQGSNSYFYPSVTGSFIFSELINSSVLTFGKVRAGWAQVGNDTDPYRIYERYTFYTSFDLNHGYRRPLQMNNTGLKPEITSSVEFGVEAAFIQNRIGFDVTFYSAETKDQILPLSLSGTTGVTSQIINAGSITNKGVEVALNLVPVKLKDFEWRLTGTFAANRNKVEALLEGVDYYRLVNAPFKVEVGAYVGEEYGVIMGTDYLYDDNGNKIVDGGFYASTNGNVPLGSVYPDFIYGISNTLTYKNINLGILFDGQSGGKFFSTSYMWGMYSGMLEETAGNNELGNPKRDDPADGGGILVDGVNEDGTPNEERIGAEDWGAWHYSGPAAQSVFKNDFFKLREITIGYTFNLKSEVIKNLNISAYGRNLAIWGPDTKHFDPEMATTNSGNIQGIEGGALPSVATYGINLGVKF